MRPPPESSSAGAARSVDHNRTSPPPNRRATVSDFELDDNEAEEEEENGEDNDDGVEEEEEYEEIEVEEYEEIIEEIEVEVDDDDDEEEEEVEEDDEEEDQPLDSTKEFDQKSNDVSQHMEFVGEEIQLNSHSTLGKSELRLPSSSLLENHVDSSKVSGPSCEPIMMQEESFVNYPEARSGDHSMNDDSRVMLMNNFKRNNEPNCDGKSPISNSHVMAAETSSPINITKNEVSDALVMKVGINMEANGILDMNEEDEATEMQPEDDKKLSVSRTRSLSPSPDLKDSNKRPAVICDFFAKGWCIKGSSCRFLHVNNKADNAEEQLEGETAATSISKGYQFNEGLRNTEENPKLPGFLNLKASSIHFSTEKNLEPQNGDTQRFQPLDDKHASLSLKRCLQPVTHQFSSSKDDLGFSFSLKDLATENIGRAEYGSYVFPISNGSSASFQNSLLPEHRSSSSGSAATSGNYRSGNPSSFLNTLNTSMYIRGHYTQASILDNSISSTHHISSRIGPSFACSSSLNSSPFGQKLFDNDRAYSRPSSLLQSASPLLGSGRENLHVTSISGDPLFCAEHKAKNSSSHWEPSIPFRPSFFITPIPASSPGSLYDPLHDSIDLPSTGYRLPFKFSFVSQGTSSRNTSKQLAYGNSLVNQVLNPECNNDKHKESIHSEFQENVEDNNHCTLRKDIIVTGAVTGGSCVVDGKKRTMPKEENASSTSHFRDIPSTSKIDADCDSRNQNDGPKRKKDVKVDRGRQINDMEVDQKIDGESRALKHFRVATIDFVKELLKPTWREGHLSKDAHNTIVKKAVDKILSTLPPHQIPSTVELSKQYLFFSQPKIAKLVEAYCVKYGKS
ncbi:protein FRIGIDA-ESSENTIAL 1 [Mercurialis annua]|uniref:protein FRIGIDA-ESSENTIAL 1 n=1 Tax=Mercurialis annua TaxID=3986 RepID=UPI0021603B1D|nr:protein FRIGIDA-ESSENTIAL 1 [Mercurialis annua]XP_050213819.1 protein FRIGIDA-ESSENTIAL 1 [Mercurialis annua]